MSLLNFLLRNLARAVQLAYVYSGKKIPAATVCDEFLVTKDEANR